MPEDIIPSFWMRVMFAPFMLVSSVGDKVQEWKANRADRKAEKAK